MGDLYYSGNGVEQDIETALEWYKKSAEQDCVEAMKCLASHYESIDPTVSEMWCNRIAEIEG